MQEAARLNATNAINALIATSPTSNLTSLPNAATGALNTSRFFTHCRGPIALPSPVTTLLGGPLTGASCSLISSALSALLSREMLIHPLQPDQRPPRPSPRRPRAHRPPC